MILGLPSYRSDQSLSPLKVSQCRMTNTILFWTFIVPQLCFKSVVETFWEALRAGSRIGVYCLTSKIRTLEGTTKTPFVFLFLFFLFFVFFSFQAKSTRNPWTTCGCRDVRRLTATSIFFGVEYIELNFDENKNRSNCLLVRLMNIGFTYAFVVMRCLVIVYSARTVQHTEHHVEVEPTNEADVSRETESPHRESFLLLDERVWADHGWSSSKRRRPGRCQVRDGFAPSSLLVHSSFRIEMYVASFCEVREAWPRGRDLVRRASRLHRRRLQGRNPRTRILSEERDAALWRRRDVGRWTIERREKCVYWMKIIMLLLL